ncbi:MAG: 50S ribosomal protein L11 methyltransferase [Flavobacteriales bacterium]|mgnify:CR=1 FL=1|jgi:ribosomal protein L11 methyltransferase|tara:strand:+ start:13117 stop:13947 length:831 start_codon:yes stop_codon:yes gene_type:complete
MSYTELTVELKPMQPFADILVARLNEINYETFLLEENILKCYIQTSILQKNESIDIILSLSDQTKINYFFNKIDKKNWNAKWEESFSPVKINSNCIIRADFHKENKDIEHEIVITPKMSFGTGHHETTFLMSNEIFNIKLTNLSILDMGSGTGVLSIISSKLGAKEVMAIDIDEWAYENSIENSILNNTNNINFFKGDVSLIRNKNFDCILANINRNIILRDLVTYYKSLIKGGKLLISGFLVEDFDIVNKKINEIGFKLINKKNKNKWLMLHLEK